MPGEMATFADPEYGSVATSAEHENENENENENPSTKHHNALGTLNGVFVPCTLNILGVILFLRLAWSVGQAGWAGTLGMFAVGETLSILTVCSLSAIVSNGNMKGGGSYYMISRCLGPEFGGSIGLLFYSAYAVGTCFYVTGFATEILNTFFTELDPNSTHYRWMTTALASGALACVMGISLLGAGAFTKVNVPLFAVQFFAILVGLVAMFVGKERVIQYNVGNETGTFTFTGPNITLLRENMMPNFDLNENCGATQGAEMCSWPLVFGVIFPAMTGIMEGANLSGDLKDPGKSIGKGTLWAVFTAICTYVTLIFAFASSFDRNVLNHNMVVMQDVSPSKYIIVIGIAISSASSALGSVFGGSRVLQALARDRMPVPGITYFAKGTVKGDEPARAVVFTWFVAQCCCLIGSLDIVAPILAAFFCLSYATVNFACLILSLSGTANFRPRFKWYSWWASAIGVLLNIAVLFFLNVWYATISIGLLLVLFVWIAFRGPATEWGDVKQAILFHQVRKYLLLLDERKSHRKYWRPSVLLLGDAPPLMSFCNDLKKGGVYVVGKVLLGELSDLAETIDQTRSAMMTDM